MRQFVYSVRHSLLPINFSLPTVTLYSSVITKLVYNDTIFTPFHDVITEFDCITVKTNRNTCVKIVNEFIEDGTKSVSRLEKRFPRTELALATKKLVHTAAFDNHTAMTIWNFPHLSLLFFCLCRLMSIISYVKHILRGTILPVFLIILFIHTTACLLFPNNHLQSALNTFHKSLNCSIYSFRLFIYFSFIHSAVCLTTGP
jgi:hypothetical protein